MFQHKVVIVILSTVFFANGHQRTPPGVNPNKHHKPESHGPNPAVLHKDMSDEKE